MDLDYFFAYRKVFCKKTYKVLSLAISKTSSSCIWIEHRKAVAVLKKSIFLVGPMGVGKSTIGKALASEMGCTFVDSDRLIEEKAGADIPWIFDVEGEEGFRKREAAALVELIQQKPHVIATGGGIVNLDSNRSQLKHSGFNVFLTASIESLIARTQGDSRRPLLQVDNPQEKIQQLLQNREPLYREVADLVIDTDQNPPKEVIKLIINAIQ